MGGINQGLLGVGTPDASRPGGPLSPATLLSGMDPLGPIGMSTPVVPPQELNAGGVVDAQKILNYISGKQGKRDGDGECFTLADKALKDAGAKSAADYGPLGKDVDYIWGNEVGVDGAQPGDIIQFRSYGYVKKDVYDNDKGSGETEASEKRPHHTAIVKSVGADGLITVWEQNVPPGTGPVHSFDLYFKSYEKFTDDKKKNGTTVTVTGTVKFYRPQAKQ